MLDFAKSTWRTFSPLLQKKKTHPSAPYHQPDALSASHRFIWYFARRNIERGDEYKRQGFSYLCECQGYLGAGIFARLNSRHDKLSEQRKDLLSDPGEPDGSPNGLYQASRKYKHNARRFRGEVKRFAEQFRLSMSIHSETTADSTAPDICVTGSVHDVYSPNVMVNVGCGSVYSFSGTSCVTIDSSHTSAGTDSNCSGGIPSIRVADAMDHVQHASVQQPRQYRYQRGMPFLTVNVMQPTPSLCGSSTPSSPRGSCDSCPATPSTANFDREDTRVPIWQTEPMNEGALDQTTAWSEICPEKEKEPSDAKGADTDEEKVTDTPEKNGISTVALLPDNNIQVLELVSNPQSPARNCVSPPQTCPTPPAMEQHELISQGIPSQIDRPTTSNNALGLFGLPPGGPVTNYPCSPPCTEAQSSVISPLTLKMKPLPRSQRYRADTFEAAETSPSWVPVTMPPQVTQPSEVPFADSAFQYHRPAAGPTVLLPSTPPIASPVLPEKEYMMDCDSTPELTFHGRRTSVKQGLDREAHDVPDELFGVPLMNVICLFLTDDQIEAYKPILNGLTTADLRTIAGAFAEGRNIGLMALNQWCRVPMTSDSLLEATPTRLSDWSDDPIPPQYRPAYESNANETRPELSFPVTSNFQAEDTANVSNELNQREAQMTQLNRTHVQPLLEPDIQKSAQAYKQTLEETDRQTFATAHRQRAERISKQKSGSPHELQLRQSHNLTLEDPRRRESDQTSWPRENVLFETGPSALDIYMAREQQMRIMQWRAEAEGASRLRPEMCRMLRLRDDIPTPAPCMEPQSQPSPPSLPQIGVQQEESAPSATVPHNHEGEEGELSTGVPRTYSYRERMSPMWSHIPQARAWCSLGPPARPRL